ncbi:metal-dependent phosphohydrolase [Thermoproteota archaeon]
MITTGEMNANKKRTVKLLKATKRPGIDKLIKWLSSTDYFTAPASTRLDYHGCHEGGLALHSLNVYDLFEARNREYGLGLQDDEVTLASICHDFCKIDQYIPNLLKSGKISSSKPYVVQDPYPFGHGEKSVLVVSKHIDLTVPEALLIRWHMGQFDAEWETYENKTAQACPAIYAFQHADHDASNYLDYKKT